MEQGCPGFTLADTGRCPDACLASAEDGVVSGEGVYFLTGDNALNSLDSRLFGAAPRSAIRGQVIHVFK